VLKSLVAAGAAIAVVLVVAGLFVDAKFDAWREQAEAANAYAGEQLVRAEAAEQVAQIAHERADSFAEIAAQVDTVIEERVRIVRAEPVPEPCVEIVAERDEVIDSLVEHVDRWRQAYQHEHGAYVSLFEAYAIARSAADTLRSVLAAMPRPRSRLLPQLGVGPFAGICAGGQPCIGVGIQLNWKIP
jgi:hypothetical protein